MSEASNGMDPVALQAAIEKLLNDSLAKGWRLSDVLHEIITFASSRARTRQTEIMSQRDTAISRLHETEVTVRDLSTRLAETQRDG